MDESRKIQEIVAYLETYCFGKDSAQMAYVISIKLSVDMPFRTTSPKLRELITKAIKGHGAVIASCNKGYYIPSNDEELLEYLNNLAMRASGIHIRQSKLLINSRSKKQFGLIAFGGE